MSFGDLLYPDNPKRRQRVAQLSQKVLDLMSRNFDATNDLIEVLNNNCGANIRKVKLVESDTIKSNCDRFIHKIEEVQNEARIIDERLSRKLDPAIYRELNNVDLSFQDVFRLTKKIIDGALSIATTVAVAAVVICVKKGLILTSLVSSVGMLGACAIAAVAVTVLMVGAGLIFGAIAGHEERKKLEAAIKDLEKILRDFEPASKEYTRNIYRVLAIVEYS